MNRCVIHIVFAIRFVKPNMNIDLRFKSSLISNEFLLSRGTIRPKVWKHAVIFLKFQNNFIIKSIIASSKTNIQIFGHTFYLKKHSSAPKTFHAFVFLNVGCFCIFGLCTWWMWPKRICNFSSDIWVWSTLQGGQLLNSFSPLYNVF